MSDPRDGKFVRVEPLSCDFVDVWRVNLPLQNESVAHLLTVEERNRANRFVRADEKYRWICARGILRILIGRYAKAPPQAIRFSAGPHGKPALAADPQGLCFNLSHAGDVALYAFTLESAVGIDVEFLRGRVDVVAVASRVFGSDTASRLQRLEGPAREREFLRAWVRHEAILKCRGMGIGAAETAMAQGPLPSITELDIGTDGAIAALAVEGMPRKVRLWTW
jgi:4'-phosphopantetheinyl transferase